MKLEDKANRVTTEESWRLRGDFLTMCEMIAGEYLKLLSRQSVNMRVEDKKVIEAIYTIKDEYGRLLDKITGSIHTAKVHDKKNDMFKYYQYDPKILSLTDGDKIVIKNKNESQNYHVYEIRTITYTNDEDMVDGKVLGRLAQ